MSYNILDVDQEMAQFTHEAEYDLMLTDWPFQMYVDNALNFS
jgi:hypothetical protein